MQRTTTQEKLKKVLGFLQSTSLKHMLMKSLIATGFVFLGLLWQGLAIFAIVILCAFVIFENNEKSLAYAFFIYCFRNFFNDIISRPISLIGVDFFIGFLIIFHLVRYFILVAKKKQALIIWPFIFLLVFFIHTLLPYGVTSAATAFSQLLFMLFILIFILFWKSLDLRELIIMFTVGLILSCVFGLVMLWAGVFPFEKSYTGTILRFSGTFKNTNTLYMASFVSIFPLMFLFLNNKIGKEFYPLFVAASLIGFSTISRFWILVYACVLIIFIIWCIIKNNKQKLIRIAIVFILLGCLAVAFYPYAKANLGRLVNLDNEFKIVTDRDIDPGRVGRWKDAFDEWTENPKTFLLGVGLDKAANNFPEHNFYLFLLRRTGLVGALLIAAFFISVYYFFNNKKWKPKIGFSIISLSVLALNLVIESFAGIFLFSLFVTSVLLCMAHEQKRIREKPTSSKLP